jgi:hypothetical protein
MITFEILEQGAKHTWGEWKMYTEFLSGSLTESCRLGDLDTDVTIILH